MDKREKRRIEQREYRAKVKKALKNADKSGKYGFSPMKPNEVVANKLKNLPKLPGIYLWKDRQERIIYVGKAKVLFNRVRSYFQDFEGKDIKTRLLVSSIRDLDWIITDTEKEALILENNLIKKYRPRYNVRLKDDKNYLSLRLSIKDDFPKLSIVRKIKKDGSIYFGPFSNAKAIRTTLRFINKIFPLRKCTEKKFSRRDRPCLNFQIDQCMGVCCEKSTKEEYRVVVRQVKMFFDGKARLLTSEMENEMIQAADEMAFEKAGKLRDAIMAVKASVERQKIVTDDFVHRDVYGLYREGGAAVVSIIFIRNGSILGHRAFPISNMELPNEEIIASVIKQYYGGENLIPKELLIDFDLGNERKIIEQWLAEMAGKKVRIIRPLQGRKKALLEMAGQNAISQFELNRARILNVQQILAKIQRRLFLTNYPMQIECFDISNLQGTNQVASQVRFYDGEPDKSGYRLYKIRTLSGQDDYKAMREVLSRRFSKPKQEIPWPDLLMIDGGKGQLNIAIAVMSDLNIEGVDVVGFTKIRNADHTEAQDMAYLPKRKNPVRFKKGSDVLFLLQRVRDESHRFAIEFHRKLRSKEQSKSILDVIEGIGPARKKALLKHFGSVKRIGEASIEDIAKVKGIPIKLAEVISQCISKGLDVDK